MVGNLFYRKVAPSELINMSYKRLKYFDDWHRLMIKEEKKARASTEGSNYG